MANIVELREKTERELATMLDNAREELFNLRFRRASGQLEDYSRLKVARREIAQLETVIHMRTVAVETASAEPEIAKALADNEWEATAHFDYEESAWQVEFSDADGGELATAVVNINKKQPASKRAAKKKGQPRRVISYEITE